MRKARAISFAFSTLIFGGCATVPPVGIPPSLLTCAGRPPVGRLDRQSDVASWIVDLDAAGEDCRGKVAAIAGIVGIVGGEGRP